MINNENALMMVNDFRLPTDVKASEVDMQIDDMDCDLDGLHFSFPRIKIPGGGVTQFEAPSDNPEKPNYLPQIVGIILLNHDTNAYWKEGSEYDMNVSPECTSINGKTGFGAPGGACITCPLNQYGTDPNGGKGKACKNMRSLYILQDGSPMPINLILPPTSRRPFADFVQNAFVLRNRPIWASLVKITLKKESQGGNNYSVAEFERLADFTGEKLLEVKEYAKAIRQSIKEMLEQRAINAEGRNESEETYTDVSDAEVSENGEAFTITDATTE